MKQNSQQQNKTRMYRNITQWRNDLVFGSIMPPSRFSAVIAKKNQKWLDFGASQYRVTVLFFSANYSAIDLCKASKWRLFLVPFLYVNWVLLATKMEWNRSGWFSCICSDLDSASLWLLESGYWERPHCCLLWEGRLLDCPTQQPSWCWQFSVAKNIAVQRCCWVSCWCNSLFLSLSPFLCT